MNLEKVNILIVDDFSVMHKIIKDALSAKGFQNFFTANNGMEALQVIKNHTIHLVITDWNMPVMDGISLLAKIRSSQQYKHLPVLMITAETKKENITEAIQSGVNEFMVKPFRPNILHDKVESILAGNSPAQVIAQPEPVETYSFDDKPVTKTEQQAPTTDASQAYTKPIIKKTNKSDSYILIVDDLPTNLDIIRGFLKEHYRLKAATSGQKAIKIIESDNPPDLILLDIMMPEMDGIQVCKHIKDNFITADIPVVFLTAKTDAESLVEAFEVGGVDYITKPVNKMELLARVKNHLQLKESKEELKQQVDLLMENARLQTDIDRMLHHDLKTPISAIITLSEQMSSHQQFKTLPDEFTENIEQIGTSSYLLMDLVNQSLNIYKIEMGTYQPNYEAFDIKTLIRRVINDVDLLAQSSQVEINPLYDDEKVITLLDELLCYSVFSNLIKNAVEASDKNNQVKIDLREIDDKVIIKIHNQTAVPEEIMESFFNKNVTFGKQQGNGLGTYSAKIMTEVQNGQITMVSDSLAGTTITLTFSSQKTE